ncbi:hypothetical protein DFH05DRAFT_1556130 [Lentinula detonsa]|uniref:Uncharacterized protein n=1 Tax=Lentinula detonsa TaxID=2804962 RepID=A0A9W8TZG1_9AGAR|nr:hypothetical protein DFH05DRAFT_1556130 [Lentinula detonsa]
MVENLCISLAVGSFGVTFSRNISELTFWKFAQTVGAGPGLSVRPSAMSHSKHIEERHWQTRLTLTSELIVIAPVFGGFITTSHGSPIRCFWVYGDWVTCVCIFLSRSKQRNKKKYIWAKKSKQWTQSFESGLHGDIIIAEALVLFANQALLIPLSVTVGVQYENTARALGACFISSGLGHCRKPQLSEYGKLCQTLSNFVIF